ncbi:AP2 domain transcription factor AP2VIIa-1 [Toxoplasma gondii TgCatPRC2]|uniref:AP2 domain transcription factor AP2VIIa-1 n=1 Tax=Toxoplasma gondii TgCatPRC2 TaxID=1130821 RepID=A0A151H3V2_TOXGO|nr:AP2 domain transcription factor AP2VIIa-1 [Toxoplasma gondii TgCatPRC2]
MPANLFGTPLSDTYSVWNTWQPTQSMGGSRYRFLQPNLPWKLVPQYFCLNEKETILKVHCPDMDISGTDTLFSGTPRGGEDSTTDAVRKLLKNDSEFPASCSATGEEFHFGRSADDCTEPHGPAFSAQTTLPTSRSAVVGGDREDHPEALSTVRSLLEKMSGDPHRQEASEEVPAASIRSPADETTKHMRDSRMLNVDDQHLELRDEPTHERPAALSSSTPASRRPSGGVLDEIEDAMIAEEAKCESTSGSSVQPPGGQQLLVELGEMFRRKQELPFDVQLLAAALEPTKNDVDVTSRGSFERRTPADSREYYTQGSCADPQGPLPNRGEECCSRQENSQEGGLENVCFDPTVNGDDMLPRRRSHASCSQHTAPENELQSGLEILLQAGAVSGNSTEGLDSSGSTRSEASVSDYSPSPSCELPGNLCPSPIQEAHLERDGVPKESEAAADTEVDSAGDRPCADHESAEHQHTPPTEAGIRGHQLQDVGAPTEARAEDNKKLNAEPLDYHAMHRALPKVTGVRFQAQRNRFVAEWYEQGRTRMAYFPVKLYGFERARHLAIRCREEVLQMKNAKRGAYGETPASQPPTTRRRNGAVDGESVNEENPALKRRRVGGNIANPCLSRQGGPGFDSSLLPVRSRTFPAPASANHRELLAVGKDIRRGFSNEERRASALRWNEGGQVDSAADMSLHAVHGHSLLDLSTEYNVMGFEGVSEEAEEQRASAVEHDSLHELLKGSRLTATSREDFSAAARSSAEPFVSRQTHRSPKSEGLTSRLNSVNYGRRQSRDSALKGEGLVESRRADWEMSSLLSTSPERSLSWTQESNQRPSRNMHERQQRNGMTLHANSSSCSSASAGLGVDPNVLLTLLLGTETSREKQATVEHALQSLTGSLEQPLASARGMGRQRVQHVAESGEDDSSLASEPEFSRLPNLGPEDVATSSRRSVRRVPYSKSSAHFEAPTESACSEAKVLDESLLLAKAAVSVILTDLLEKCIPRLITMGKESTDETALQLRRGFLTSVVMQAWRAVQDAQRIDQLYPLLAVCRRTIVAGELPSSSSFLCNSSSVDWRRRGR